MVNIADEIECSKGGQSVKIISNWIFLAMGQPVGFDPVSAGVVPGSQASGKVANCEVRIEPACGRQVSQTAMFVPTPLQARGRLDRNYIRRLSGRMRWVSSSCLNLFYHRTFGYQLT